MLTKILAISLMQSPVVPAVEGPPASTPAGSTAPGPIPAENTPPVVDSRSRQKQREEEESVARVGINPVTSIPIPGPIPGQGHPSMDVIAAYATVSTKDTELRVAASPFAFMRRYFPVLSDTRLELYGNSSTRVVGGALALGWTTMTKKLRADDLETLRSKCGDVAIDEMEKLASQLADEIRAQNNVSPPPPILAKNTSDWKIKLQNYSGQLIAAWKNVPNAKELQQGEDLSRKLLEISDKVTLERAQCVGKALREYRMESAYHHGVSIFVSGGAELFPYFHGPRPEKPVCTSEQTPAEDNCMAMDATETEYMSASGKVLSAWKVKASLAYFPSQRLGVFLTGSLSGERKDPRKLDLGVRAGGSLAVIGNVYVGKMQEDGFLPGIGLGVAGDYQSCVAKNCDFKVVGFEKPLFMSYTLGVTPLIEIRASSKVQVMLSVPIQQIHLAQPADKTDGSLSAFQIVPTLSVGIASWGFRPRT